MKTCKYNVCSNPEAQFRNLSGMVCVQWFSGFM